LLLVLVNDNNPGVQEVIYPACILHTTFAKMYSMYLVYNYNTMLQILYPTMHCVLVKYNILANDNDKSHYLIFLGILCELIAKCLNKLHEFLFLSLVYYSLSQLYATSQIKSIQVM